MVHRMRLLGLMLLVAAVSTAEDRFAVLEFFGRPLGANCSAAGPAMMALQNEYRGRAVLLEYYFDDFRVGRIDRFWATGTSASYLPFVMVGSGYRITNGAGDYENDYRDMIDAELARPAEAAVTAFWRRSGSSMRVYLEARNLRSTELRPAQEAAFWVVAWENARIGVGTTWVRSAVRRSLAEDLAPGETTAAVVDTPAMAGVDWSEMVCLVLVEDRAPAGGRYDMLQAAEALPATFTVAPESLVLGPGRPAAEIVLAGPHVLEWAATTDVPWLELEPAEGNGLATVTVTLLPEARPPTATQGAITFDAAGDGMAFSSTVYVEVAGQVRRGSQRLRPE